MNIEELDSNWVTPAALAKELKIPRSTVSSWITRKQIDFVELPGAIQKRYLVNRLKTPEQKSVGRPLGS
jgi:hypothetical protein